MGNAAAQYLYGIFLLQGKYIAKDLIQSEKYIKLSAEQGYEHALADYGLLLIVGNVYTQNVSAGAKMLCAALDSQKLPVKKRFIVAELLLFVELYDTSLSSAEYLEFQRKARQGIEVCASQKYDKALEEWKYQKDLTEEAFFLTKGAYYRDKNFPAAKLVYDSAILAGYNEASLVLACLFLEGKYTKRNIYTARQYAERYLPMAAAKEQYALLYLFFEQKDYEFSLSRLSKLAENGHTPSQNILFRIFFEGCDWASKFFDNHNDIPRDNAKAIRFLKMAAQNDDPSALEFLGLFYLAGDVLPQNYELGLKYIRRAADLGSTFAKDMLKEIEGQSMVKSAGKTKISLAEIKAVAEKGIVQNKLMPMAGKVPGIKKMINPKEDTDFRRRLDSVIQEFERKSSIQKSRSLIELIESSTKPVAEKQQFPEKISLHNTLGNPSYGIILWLDGTMSLGEQLNAQKFQKHPAKENLNNLHKYFQSTTEFFNKYFNWKSYDNNDSVCKVYYELKAEEPVMGGTNQINDFMNAMAFPMDTMNAGIYYAYGFAFFPALILQDIITHEFVHAITDWRINNKHNALIYFAESGALNESFSDIFACLQRITDNPEIPVSERWKIGSNQKVFTPRNLANPTSNMPEYYQQEGKWCDNPDIDLGGVHHNSSVLGKMAYLLCDGGSFRGHDIKAMGPEKVGKLFWQLQDIKYIDINQRFNDLAERILRAALDAGFSDSDLLNILNACLAINLPVDKNYTQYTSSVKSASLFRNTIVAAGRNEFSDKLITSQQSLRKLFKNDEIGEIYVKEAPPSKSKKNNAFTNGKLLNIVNNPSAFIGGNKVYLTTQTFSAIPVFGTSAVIHTNHLGQITSFKKNFSKNIVGMSIERKEFPDKLKKQLFGQQSISAPKIRIFDPVLFKLKGKPAIVWQIDTQTHRYLVDQTTEKVVFSYPRVIIN